MRVEVYEDEAGEWRWRIRAANHKIVGGSEEGYKRKKYAVSMAERIGQEIPVQIVDADADKPAKKFWKR